MPRRNAIPDRPHGVLAVALLASALGACATDDGEERGCVGKCDSRDDVLRALEGRADPIATFLRAQSLDSKGRLRGDYATVARGVATTMGCAEDSIRTFTLSDPLVTGEPFPRLISVACGDDVTRAGEFFIAASFRDEKTKDVDLRTVEMFAWDATARRYRFYALDPATKTRLSIDVEPARCAGCHLTPTDVGSTAMHMTPIMNELTRPWTHWNAEPGFPSFDFKLPAGIAKKPNFKAWSIARRAPASRFEEIVRAAHTRVAQARIRERRDPVDLDRAMGLLRPVFCAEQVNYASEDFGSGQLTFAALTDPSMRDALLAIKPTGWPWAWVNDATLRLPPTTSAKALRQVPVRGNADAALIQQHLAFRTLTPRQVLRARALDWQHPVLSEFRCGLWQDAAARFEATPPDLSKTPTVADAIPVLFEQIMTLDGKPLAPTAADRVLALPNAATAEVDALRAALAAGTTAGGTCTATGGFCVQDDAQLGGAIDAHAATVLGATAPRDALKAVRDARLCEVTRTVDPADGRFEEPGPRFPNQPALPKVSCPAASP